MFLIWDRTPPALWNKMEFSTSTKPPHVKTQNLEKCRFVMDKTWSIAVHFG